MDDIQELTNAVARIAANVSNLREQLRDTETWLEEANRKVDAITLSRDLERTRGDTLHTLLATERAACNERIVATQPLDTQANAPVGGIVHDLKQRLEAMRLAHAGYIADAERYRTEAIDNNANRITAEIARDNLRQSAIAAGCVEIEVCAGCGSPADGSGCNPCKLPFTKRRLVNRRAEDAVRERDSLRAELSTERRSHNQRMAALVTLKFEFDTLKRQLSRSNHNMDATGQCSANCPACEEVRQLARAETADAPNMCRDGHPEIRYEQGEDAHGCPLCRALSRLSSWERKMPCGHPEAALMVDDPPYCAVCNQQFEINKMVNALRALKLRIHFIGWPAEAMVDRGDGVMVPDWRNEIKILEDALAGHGGADDHPLNRYIGGTHADH